jgi:hypothetical protein
MTVSVQGLVCVLISVADITIRNWFVGQQIEVFDFYNGIQIGPAMELLSGAPSFVGDASATSSWAGRG